MDEEKQQDKTRDAFGRRPRVRVDLRGKRTAANRQTRDKADCSQNVYRRRAKAQVSKSVIECLEIMRKRLTRWKETICDAWRAAVRRKRDMSSQKTGDLQLEERGLSWSELQG